jgi:hypothetical protein
MSAGQNAITTLLNNCAGGSFDWTTLSHPASEKLYRFGRQLVSADRTLEVLLELLTERHIRAVALEKLLLTLPRFSEETSPEVHVLTPFSKFLACLKNGQPVVTEEKKTPRPPSPD